MSYTRTTWQNSETALSAANMNNIEDGIEEALEITRDLYDKIYPVGSIYMSINSTDPAELFEGTTWTQIEDRFLLAAGSTYTAGNTGGSATHKLTVNEMPSHKHTVSYAAYGRATGEYTASALQYSTTTEDTSSVGGGAAHNNMPPYLVVYVWKRTA